jgi:hypothetical protein
MRHYRSLPDATSFRSISPAERAKKLGASGGVSIVRNVRYAAADRAVMAGAYTRPLLSST